MTVLNVRHLTRYSYAEPVQFGPHRLMMRPRDSHDLRLLDTALTIAPAASVRWLHDVFGNSVAVAEFTGPSSELLVESSFRAEHFPLPAEELTLEDHARRYPFSYDAREIPDIGRTVERHYPDPNATVSGWAKQFLEGEDGTDTFAMLTHMCKGIQETLKYAMRFEAGTQPPAVTCT